MGWGEADNCCSSDSGSEPDQLLPHSLKLLPPHSSPPPLPPLLSSATWLGLDSWVWRTWKLCPPLANQQCWHCYMDSRDCSSMADRLKSQFILDSSTYSITKRIQKADSLNWSQKIWQYAEHFFHQTQTALDLYSQHSHVLQQWGPALGTSQKLSPGVAWRWWTSPSGRLLFTERQEEM